MRVSHLERQCLDSIYLKAATYKNIGYFSSCRARTLRNAKEQSNPKYSNLFSQTEHLHIEIVLDL